MSGHLRAAGCGKLGQPDAREFQVLTDAIYTVNWKNGGQQTAVLFVCGIFPHQLLVLKSY